MSKDNPKILRNSGICLDCGEEIESKFRHDFRSCACGNLSVDGGRAYVRRLFKNYDRIQDTSLYDETREPSDGDYR